MVFQVGVYGFGFTCELHGAGLLGFGFWLVVWWFMLASGGLFWICILLGRFGWVAVLWCDTIRTGGGGWTLRGGFLGFGFERFGWLLGCWLLFVVWFSAVRLIYVV